MDVTLVDRARQAIDGTQMTREEFARAVGLTPDKLSKALNGRRNFTSLELARVAEATGQTVDWFLSGRTVETPSLAARVSPETTVKLSEIEALAKRFSAANRQLVMLGLDRTMESLPPVPPGRFVEAASSMANFATSRLAAAGFTVERLSTLELIDAVETVFDVDIAVTNLTEGMDGCAWQDSSMRLIMLNRTRIWVRQRFTLAHELGHVLARDAQNSLIAEDVMARGESVSERRANSFAAALLMPEAHLREVTGGEVASHETFVALVNTLCVSPTSLAWRLHNLGLIRPEDKEEWISMTAEGAAMSARDPDLVIENQRLAMCERLPTRLVREHMQAYYRGDASARPLASLLDEEPARVIDLLADGAEER